MTDLRLPLALDPLRDAAETRPLTRRHFAASGLALLALSGLAGCGGEEGEGGEGGESGATTTTELAGAGDAKSVNIYSARHYPADEKLFALFTQQTGIAVRMIQGKAEELMERLRLEGANSPCDVFIAVDAGNLWRAQNQGAFQPVESAELAAQIPPHLREAAGHWFAFATRARVILYDKEKISPQDIRDYEDLADPRWRGRILIRSSNNIYNQSLLASIVAADGAAAAESWATGLVENFARKPEGGDIDQIKALIAGEGSLAVSNTYYFARLLAGEEPDLLTKLDRIGILFPNQTNRGTHVNVSGAGIAAHAPHRENAVKFLEYLISPPAQEIFAGANYEFPVRGGVASASVVAGWGGFKADTLPVAKLGEFNAEAVMIMDRVGWN